MRVWEAQFRAIYHICSTRVQWWSPGWHHCPKNLDQFIISPASVNKLLIWY